MRKAFRSLTVMVCVLTLSTSGCGLILGYGGPQPVDVITTPEGAELIVDGVAFDGGKTPTQVLLHPKSEHNIEARLPDGSRGQTYISKKIRIPVVVMDGVFTLAIGLLIDYLSGSLYEVETPIQINLGKAPPPAPPTPPPSTSNGPATDAAPCSICGEPRGDVTPCPHCGME